MMSSSRTVSTKRAAFYIVACILCGLAVVYFAQIQHAIVMFTRINPYWLIVAVLAQVGTYFCGALVYTYLTQSMDKTLKFRPIELLRAMVIALSINQTIPSAGLSGNLFMFGLFQKKGASAHRAFILILLELVSFYVAIIGALAGMIVLIATTRVVHTPFLTIAIIGIVVYGMLLLITIGFGKKQIVSWVSVRLFRIPFFANRIPDTQRALFVTTQHLWSTFIHQTPALRLVLLQIGYIATDTLTIYGLLHGLGFALPFYLVCIGFLSTKIIALLPITPGALLVYEGGMTAFYTLLGVPVQGALVVTLLYRVLSFWVPMPIGLLLYRRFNFRLV